MAVVHCDAPFRRLEASELAFWEASEASGVSDCQGRSMAMDGGLQPLVPGRRLVGQARTVRCMVGDNSALHVALDLAEPGEVLVVDGEGNLGHALWGALMTEAAQQRGIAGIVVDGAVRDSEHIAASGFPCFARGRVPAGPHKGFGGAVDVAIACGGVPVHAGDLIVGDADGVVVVPLARVEEIRDAYRSLKERERRALEILASGGRLGEVYGVPEVTRGVTG